MPGLSGIQACLERWPGCPQIAVFDTAFHQSLPARAYTYALPREADPSQTVRRYGFHGTSHRYVAAGAAQRLASSGRPVTPQRLITCHLGNGCSLAAIRDGQCCDTSMGFTPLEGLVMGTRAGDLDPAVLLYLAERFSLTAADLEDLLNHRSGLLGLSGLSSDVRDLQAAARAGHPRAQLALDVYAYRVRAMVGALAVSIGGIDALVFTGGIGENSVWLRRQVCDGLECLGIRLDNGLNESRRADVDIAQPDSPARVLIIHTREDLMIAREARRLAIQ